MDFAAPLVPLLGAHLAPEATGDLKGLLTVLGTLAFVGSCFVVVELLDQRGSAHAGPSDHVPVSSRVVAGQADLTSGAPADDVWPLRSVSASRRRPAGPDPHRRLLGSALGAMLAIGVASALIPVRSDVGSASVALALVLVVVAAAAVGGRVAAAATSAVAALAFNFTHTAPLYTFHIAHGADVVTSVLMILIGVAVGELAVRTFPDGPTPGVGSPGAPSDEILTEEMQ